MGSFRVIDDVAIADVALDIEGEDAADVFATAARALAELVVDPATLAGEVARRIRLEAAELDLLLFDFLAELVFVKDRDGVVLPRATVRVDGGPPWRLDAELAGGRIVRGRTTLRADAKAVTLHELRCAPTADGRVAARVVIDL